MAQPMTGEERARICNIYRQCRNSQQQIETPHRVVEKIATRVGRCWTSVYEVLVKEKLVPAPRPRGLSDRTMKKVAEAYYSAGWSLRKCAKNFELSFGVVRAVLLYEEVELRGRGAAGRVAPRSGVLGHDGRGAALIGEPDRRTVDDAPARAVNDRPSGIRS